MTEIKIPDFINKFEKILENYKDFLKKKKEYGFNIFSVSTYTSHLENFHSDVLHSLLTPNGLHNEVTLFIEKFFEYLKLKHNINIGDISNIDFNNVKVNKEIGDKHSRIDILITYNEKNDTKTNAIIFENKINNAQDTKKQLEKYYNWCSTKNYEVVSILYASIDGYKEAPKTEKEEINQIIKNIIFFKEKNDACLVNGWLRKCQPTNEDTKSFLNQYIKLLKFLGANTMNKENMEEFYKKAGNQEIQEKLQLINELNNNLPVYRTEKFFEKFKKDKIEPFKKIDIRTYKGCVELVNFFNNNGDYRIEIDYTDFLETKIEFWRAKGNENEKSFYKEKVKGIITEINDNSFNVNYNVIEEDKNYNFSFTLDKYGSLEKVDEKIFDFFEKIIFPVLNKNL